MNIGMIGCGNIVIDHVKGLIELKKKGIPAFDLTALCDIRLDRAEKLAIEVESLLGYRPHVYQDYREMLDKEDLHAVSVLVTHDLHHTVAEDCFAAGVHVQMQKPLAITPRFGLKIIEDAKKYNRVVTVSEPIVLGAEAVALARAVKDGLIGQPYLTMDYAATTEVVERGFFGGTPWRHMKGKAGAGWINDHGVHHAHLFTEVIGSIDEVFAYTEIFHKELTDGQVTIRPSGEDTAVTVFRHKNGALGHWMCATSAHGERASGTWFYGSKGCLRPGKHAALDNGKIITMDELVNQYAPEVVKDRFAHSYVDLWDAIVEGKSPVSSAEKGLEALGVVFAALESAATGQPVRVKDILDGTKHAYEDTVVEEMTS